MKEFLCESCMKESKDIAEEHASWFSKWAKQIYIESFQHGYKHGKHKRKD